MQKAHGLVLVEGKQPEILGGKSGGLTMPPLDAALSMQASDVILSVGRPPLAKRAGRVETLAGGAVNEADLGGLLDRAGARRGDVEASGSADFAIEHGPRRTRFRVNVFRQLD